MSSSYKIVLTSILELELIGSDYFGMCCPASLNLELIGQICFTSGADVAGTHSRRSRESEEEVALKRKAGFFFPPKKKMLGCWMGHNWAKCPLLRSLIT